MGLGSCRLGIQTRTVWPQLSCLSVVSGSGRQELARSRHICATDFIRSSYWPYLEPHAQHTQRVPFFQRAWDIPEMAEPAVLVGGAGQGRHSLRAAAVARRLTQIPWGRGRWAGVQGRAAGLALAALRKARNLALPRCRACSLISDGWCPRARCLFRGRSFRGGALVPGEKQQLHFQVKQSHGGDSVHTVVPSRSCWLRER